MSSLHRPCLTSVQHCGWNHGIIESHFADFFNSLLTSACFLIAPIRFDASPILCSISSSQLPLIFSIAPGCFSASPLLQCPVHQYSPCLHPSCIFMPQLSISFFTSIRFYSISSPSLLTASPHHLPAAPTADWWFYSCTLQTTKQLVLFADDVVMLTVPTSHWWFIGYSWKPPMCSWCCSQFLLVSSVEYCSHGRDEC